MDFISIVEQVCRKFNDIGSNLLSRGFMQIERRNAAMLKRVKSLLPRRESERRVHPLFRHCDILSAVETRISMLNMTYMKYIQRSRCCFIPGKVLDELDRVLNVVEKMDPPPKTNEILQELRDISSMAMEFFDEKLLPSFRDIDTPGATTSQFVHAIAASKPRGEYLHPALQAEIRRLTRLNKRQHAHINSFRKEVEKLNARLEKQRCKIKRQKVYIREHRTALRAQAQKSWDQDATIAELKKTVGEWEQKLSALAADVVTSRDDIVKAIFAVPPVSPESQSAAPQPLPHKTIIRPRVSQVQGPNTYIVEMERKRKASIDVDIPNKLRFILRHDSNALALKEQVANKINENITQNIAKNIRNEVADTSKKKYDFSRIFTTSMDAILRTSLGNIAPKKRRYTADSDVLVNLH